MKRTSSNLTQQCSPCSITCSTITGRIRGFFHSAFPRQSVARVLQPLPHTEKTVVFSILQDDHGALFFTSLPKNVQLPKASGWVEWNGLRGCKSLSPHYYCRIRCGRQRADVAILWVYCLRNLLFWGRMRSSDPSAWISQGWKILFYIKDFLLSACFRTILVRPLKVSDDCLCAYPHLWINVVLNHCLKLEKRAFGAQQLLLQNGVSLLTGNTG